MRDSPARKRQRRAHAENSAKAARNRALMAVVEETGRGRKAQPEEVERADAWVCEGVQKLAATAPGGDHVVLMAATHGFEGVVGVSSAVRCEAMTAMRALGRLVAEVNEAFLRDGVDVKVTLRMSLREKQYNRHDELKLR